MAPLNSERQWWAPVWKGLVVDAEAKHYRRMKSAVWLYLYFILNADRRTGILKRKIQTIESGMGITRDTAIRWLNVLRTEGYVSTVNTGRSLTIQISRWRPILRTRNTRPQPLEAAKPRRGGNPTAWQRCLPPNPEQTGRTLMGQGAANKTQREINKFNQMQQSTFDEPPDRTFGVGKPWVAHELLAHELAQSLDDAAGMNHYRACCWKHPEWLLRKVASEVIAMTSTSIAKPRSELFNELLQHYAKGTSENPGS